MTGQKRGGRLRSDPEAGAATVLAVGIIAVLLTLTVAIVMLIHVVSARAVATTAADLAALAGASAHQHSSGQPCHAAARVAAANEAVLIVCTQEGEDILVRTAVEVHLGVFGQHTAIAQARAGPVQ